VDISERHRLSHGPSGRVLRSLATTNVAQIAQTGINTQENPDDHKGVGCLRGLSQPHSRLISITAHPATELRRVCLSFHGVPA
jgi:hypothetical protein